MATPRSTTGLPRPTAAGVAAGLPLVLALAVLPAGGCSSDEERVRAPAPRTVPEICAALSGTLAAVDDDASALEQEVRLKTLTRELDRAMGLLDGRARGATTAASAVMAPTSTDRLKQLGGVAERAVTAAERVRTKASSTTRDALQPVRDEVARLLGRRDVRERIGPTLRELERVLDA